MKFEEALSAIKIGMKAKRKTWEENIYISITSISLPKGDAILLWTNDKSYSDVDIVAREGQYWGVPWITCYFEILGEDWEVIQE